MPCALALDADYPDYVKTILKEIQAGNDEELKTCACQLKTPVNSNGCSIFDEDGKLGVFPFCWEYTENTSLVGDGTLNPIRLSLKDAMWLYWKSANFKHNVRYYEGPIGDTCDFYSYKFINNKLNKNNTSTGVEYNGDKKLLVCAHSVNLVYDLTIKCSKEGGGSWTYILASFFAGDNFLIKEGDKYYFYPYFRSSYFGGYAGSTDTDNNFGIDPGQVGCGVNAEGSVTDYSVEAKIKDTTVKFKNYYCGTFAPPIENILEII